MNSFESELRARFERAAEVARPSEASRVKTLGRARRRRIINGIVAGGAAIALVSGALFMSGLPNRSPGGEVDAATRGTPELPAGHLEILEAPTREEAWVLSWAPEGGCLAITSSAAHSEICDPAHGVVDVHQVSHGGTTFVFGAASRKVDSVFLQVAEARDTIFVGLHAAPQKVPGNRRYFATAVPRGTAAEALFAYRDDGDVEAIVLRSGATMDASGGSVGCGVQTAMDKLDKRIRQLKTELRHDRASSSKTNVREAEVPC